MSCWCLFRSLCTRIVGRGPDDDDDDDDDAVDDLFQPALV